MTLIVDQKLLYWNTEIIKNKNKQRFKNIKIKLEINNKYI